MKLLERREAFFTAAKAATTVRQAVSLSFQIPFYFGFLFIQQLIRKQKQKQKKKKKRNWLKTKNTNNNTEQENKTAKNKNKKYNNIIIVGKYSP